jgi:hypothetical protein
MKSLMSKVAHKKAPSPVVDDGNQQVLTIARPTHSSDLVNLHLAGLPNTTAPLYVARVKRFSTAPIELYRGNDVSLSNPIASAKVHTMSWNTDMVLNDQDFKLSYGQWSGKLSGQHPTLGDIYWKAKWTGSGCDMFDANGRHLAKLKIGNMLNEKELELFITCEKDELDYIVATAMVVKAINHVVKSMANVALGATD